MLPRCTPSNERTILRHRTNRPRAGCNLVSAMLLFCTLLVSLPEGFMQQACQLHAGILRKGKTYVLNRSSQARPRQSRIICKRQGFGGCTLPTQTRTRTKPQTPQGLPPSGICIARNMSMVCRSGHQAKSKVQGPPQKSTVYALGTRIQPDEKARIRV